MILQPYVTAADSFKIDKESDSETLQKKKQSCLFYQVLRLHLAQGYRLAQG